MSQGQHPKPISPQETEKIWHGFSDPQEVLQLHHREHPDGLHRCLVWQLLSLRLLGTTEGSAYGPVHHRGQASCHPGPLYQVVSEEGPKHCQRLQPPQSQTVLSATTWQEQRNKQRETTVINPENLKNFESAAAKIIKRYDETGSHEHRHSNCIPNKCFTEFK